MMPIATIRAALLALALLLAFAPPVAAQNPFGRGSQPNAESAPRGEPAAAPTLLQRWYETFRRWQSSLTRGLGESVRAYKERGAPAPVLALLLISFLYGVAHAVGPGHGKAATAAYFGTNRARAMQGLSMAAAIGLVQALSAILFVGAFVLLFRATQTETLRSVLYIEAASYLLIALVGLWIAWGGVIGRGCTHNHGLAAAHGHDHAHHGHGHDHSHHGHAHDRAHRHDPPAVAGWRSMWPVAVASGIRPCTGAILVLLFTLSQGIFEIGVLATFVMSLGTFLVVAAIGLGAIFARRAAQRSGASERWANLAQRATGILGGLIVFGFGALFLHLSLQQLGLI
jgi:ABC-type nickel/cobalt efflux system permease component RcnA